MKIFKLLIIFALLSACAHKAPQEKHFINAFAELPHPEKTLKHLTQSCAPAPDGPKDIETVSRYTLGSPGTAHSTPALLEQEKRTTAIFRDYLDQLVDWTDEQWMAKGGSPQAVACVQSWLEKWAIDRAMLNHANAEGTFERKWMLSGLALVALRLQASGVKQPLSEKSKNWLTDLALKVRQDFDSTQKASRRNNHLYWAALGVMATAILIQDSDLYEWSLVKIRLGLEQIDPSGFLPLELERRQRARHYHAFSLQPLVMAAFLALPNGTDFYLTNQGRLHTLSQTTADGFDDPSIFQKASGFVQEQPRWHDTKWLEIYNFRFPERVKVKWLERFRPGRERWLGGNLTLTFAPTANAEK